MVEYIKYPNEGRCEWECDATFMGDKPWEEDDDDGTNRPEIGDSEVVYALVVDGATVASVGTIKGYDGTRYRTWDGDYEDADAYAGSAIYDEDSSLYNDTTYYSLFDNGRNRLYVTANGRCKRVANYDGSRITYDQQGNDPFDYSNRVQGAVRFDIFMSDYFSSAEGVRIYYGQWEGIRKRVHQQNVESIRALANDTFFPSDDQHPDYFLPCIIADVYRPDFPAASHSPKQPFDYTKVRWKCHKYSLPSNEPPQPDFKTQQWKITDNRAFRIKDQYGHTERLPPCPPPEPVELQSTILIAIDPYIGGEECSCEEGWIKCKGNYPSRKVCCVNCCKIGEEVLRILSPITPN